MQEQKFASKYSLDPVTQSSEIGRFIFNDHEFRLIDTPGLCDPRESLKSKEDIKEFARALFQASNGIHAFAIVIRLIDRVEKEYIIQIREFLETMKLLPYTFLIFSCADHISMPENIEAQNTAVDQLLAECNQHFTDLLLSIEHRYLILDSKNSKEKDYHICKMQKLIDITSQIQQKTCRVYINELTILANYAKQQNIDVNVFIEQIYKALQELKELKESKDHFDPKFFYGALVGGALIATLGAAGVGLTAAP